MKNRRNWALSEEIPVPESKMTDFACVKISEMYFSGWQKNCQFMIQMNKTQRNLLFPNAYALEALSVHLTSADQYNFWSQ